MVKILKTHLIGKESFLQIEKYFINMHKDRNRVSHINEELTAKEILKALEENMLQL